MGVLIMFTSLVVMILTVTTSTTYAIAHTAEVCSQRYAEINTDCSVSAFRLATSATVQFGLMVVDWCMHAGDLGVIP